MATHKLTSVREKVGLFLGLLACTILVLTLLILLMMATFAAAALMNLANTEAKQSDDVTSYDAQHQETQQEPEAWRPYVDEVAFAAVDARE